MALNPTSRRATGSLIGNLAETKGTLFGREIFAERVSRVEIHRCTRDEEGGFGFFYGESIYLDDVFKSRSNVMYGRV